MKAQCLTLFSGFCFWLDLFCFNFEDTWLFAFTYSPIVGTLQAYCFETVVTCAEALTGFLHPTGGHASGAIYGHLSR